MFEKFSFLPSFSFLTFPVSFFLCSFDFSLTSSLILAFFWFWHIYWFNRCFCIAVTMILKVMNYGMKVKELRFEGMQIVVVKRDLDDACDIDYA